MFTIHAVLEYNCNVVLATELLKTAAIGHPKVSREEPVIVRMSNFSENGIEMNWCFGQKIVGILVIINLKFGSKSTDFSVSTRFILPTLHVL